MVQAQRVSLLPLQGYDDRLGTVREPIGIQLGDSRPVGHPLLSWVQLTPTLSLSCSGPCHPTPSLAAVG